MPDETCDRVPAPDIVLGGDVCQQCQHAFDPHVLVTTTGDPLDGGIILCPVPRCRCFGTWGTQAGRASVEVPDEVEVEVIRASVQSGEVN